MVQKWIRNSRRSPLLTAQFVLTIVLGMGTAASLVSLMFALGEEPLPYTDSSRLVEIWERVESGSEVVAISGPDLADFAEATKSSFVALGGFANTRFWLVDRRGPIEASACYIQASAFSSLGIRPVLGRGVFPSDESLVGGPEAPAWISYEFWKTRYGSSPSIIGTSIGLSDGPTAPVGSRVRVVGVLPRSASIPFPSREIKADLWYLLPPGISSRSRESNVFFGLGRLQAGVSPAQAESAIGAVAQRLGQRYVFDRRKHPVVRSLEEVARGPVKRTMGLLTLGLGLVFLVGCANLAVLMGAEGRARRRDIAIQFALGASARRLWLDLTFEKGLLTLVSLALAVPYAINALRLLAWLIPAADLGPPLSRPPELNFFVLVGFAVVALAATVVWSLLLAGAAGGGESFLAGGGGPGHLATSDSRPGAGRWWFVLIAAQTGLGICLLGAAAVTAGAYIARSALHLGPAPGQIVLMSLSPPDNAILTDAKAEELNREVLATLERLPNTRAVALADMFPPSGFPAAFRKPGDADDITREATLPASVSPDYFRALGIPILFGRGFTPADDIHGEPVAIISLDLAERNWPSPGDSIGSEVIFGPKSRYKVIGVAANFGGYWFQHPVPGVYLPERQWKGVSAAAIIRTAASPESVAALAPRLLSAMPIPVTAFDVSSMQARWQATLTRPLARMVGMTLLAVLGLLLSFHGAYSVAAASVAARRHELAVRSALGAPGRLLVWSVTRRVIIAVLFGAASGAGAAIALKKLLEQWMGPLTESVVTPIAAAIVLLWIAVALGCYFPARAALRTDPARLLRHG